MPEATAGTAGGNQRQGEEENKSFLQKYKGTIIQMVVMWLVSRYLFGGGCKQCRPFLAFQFPAILTCSVYSSTSATTAAERRNSPCSC